MSRGRGRAVSTPDATKRLVAHVPYRWRGFGDSAQDGEPVGVPAPCARLLAGYWCSCGEGFTRATEQEHTLQARVEAVPAGATAKTYNEQISLLHDTDHPTPPAGLHIALLAQTDSLPVGTVVERRGAGIAPSFDSLIDAAADGQEVASWNAADYPF